MGLEAEPGANTSGALKIYPLREVFGDTMESAEAVIRPWLERIGWTYEIFGPPNGERRAIYPDFKDPATPSYGQRVAWLFDPALEEGSFRPPSGVR